MQIGHQGHRNPWKECVLRMQETVLSCTLLQASKQPIGRLVLAAVVQNGARWVQVFFSTGVGFKYDTI